MRSGVADPSSGSWRATLRTRVRLGGEVGEREEREGGRGKKETVRTGREGDACRPPSPGGAGPPTEARGPTSRSVARALAPRISGVGPWGMPSSYPGGSPDEGILDKKAPCASQPVPGLAGAAPAAAGARRRRGPPADRLSHLGARQMHALALRAVDACIERSPDAVTSVEDLSCISYGHSSLGASMPEVRKLEGDGLRQVASPIRQGSAALPRCRAGKLGGTPVPGWGSSGPSLQSRTNREVGTAR